MESDIPQDSVADKVLAQIYKRLGIRVSWQHILDRTTIWTKSRWSFFVASVALYALKVYFSASHYIVTYGLSIYLLNLFIAFLTPQVDPELEGPTLPSKSGEFRPFARRLPEFKFWYSCVKAVWISICMSLFRIFDIPVFWPILVVYFFVLFFLTMRKQIAHMYKHKYIPVNFGKPKYDGRRDPLSVPGGGGAMSL